MRTEAELGTKGLRQGRQFSGAALSPQQSDLRATEPYLRSAKQVWRRDHLF